jgi:peptide-methionine (R)-S-oxide reductase
MNKRVEKTEAQWREQLDPMEYQVTREAATERAFTGRYWIIIMKPALYLRVL